MNFLRSIHAIFYTLLLTILPNPTLSNLNFEYEIGTSTSLVDCLNSASDGLNLKGVTMLSGEFERSSLADTVMKALKAPVTITALGSKLQPQGVYVVFSQESYEELLKRTTTEDDVMWFILLRWGNKFEADRTFGSIFSDVSTHRISRTFVLVEQDNSNVEVYTYFPLNHSCSGKFGTPTIVDVWDSTKKYLTTNIFEIGLFYSRRTTSTTNFCRRSFKSLVISFPPESTVKDSEKDTLKFQGRAGRLLTSAMQLNNFTLSIQLVEDTLEGYYRDKNGYVVLGKSVQPLIQALVTNQFDIAFGYFAYAAISSPDIDFSLSYLRDNFGFFVPCGTKGNTSTLKNYYLEFSVLTWVCIAIMFFLLSYGFKLITRLPSEESSYFSHNGRNMLILFGVHLENVPSLRPRSNTMRSFLTLVMFYCMVLSVCYKASLKSFLMAPLGSRSIETWEELEMSGLTINTGPLTYSVLKDLSEDQPILKKVLKHFELLETEVISEAFYAVTKRRATAFFGPESVVNYLNTLGTQENGKVRQPICRIPRNIASIPITPFIVRKGSPLTKVISRAITSHLQCGLMKLFGSPGFSKPTSESGLKSEQEAYKLKHLEGAFYMWLFGTIIAVFVFYHEILYFKFHPDRVIVL